MKYICTILTLIFITLSAIPCADSQSNALSTSHVSFSDSSSHKKQSKDDCSPFCTCNCCRTILCLDFGSQIAKEVIASSPIRKKQQSYVSVAYSRFHGSIWQPPKIS
ncbi:DUF6660 family protein [Flavobacterium sp. ASV13]|uniref:DUF6660 family protein n=1 Tax=Flavobacterium sp. ASV13 TaxID=1506583 RepID=UPI003527621C